MCACRDDEALFRTGQTFAVLVDQHGLPRVAEYLWTHSVAMVLASIKSRRW